MGCWNGTCGVSQLPILHGDKIRVFILSPHYGTDKFVTEPNSFVYSTDMFKAMGVPFVAEYNDYGSVENIVEDYNTKIIHDILAKTAVLPKDKPFTKGDEVTYIKEKKEIGSSYLEVLDIEGDMATVRERLRGPDAEQTIVPISELRHSNCEGYYDDFGDLERTIDLIERNVFEVNNKIWVQFGMKPTAIPGLFFVRENVWQALIADLEEESDYAFGFKTRKTMLKQIDEFLAELKENIIEADSSDEETKIRSIVRLYDLEYVGGKKNQIGNMFRMTSDGFSANLYKNHIINAVREGDMSFAKKMLSDILDTTRFMDSMRSLRKSLIPQCGVGSQDIGEEYHEALNKAVAMEIDSIKHRWDEEEYS